MTGRAGGRYAVLQGHVTGLGAVGAVGATSHSHRRQRGGVGATWHGSDQNGPPVGGRDSSNLCTPGVARQPLRASPGEAQVTVITDAPGIAAQAASLRAQAGRAARRVGRLCRKTARRVRRVQTRARHEGAARRRQSTPRRLGPTQGSQERKQARPRQTGSCPLMSCTGCAPGCRQPSRGGSEAWMRGRQRCDVVILSESQGWQEGRLRRHSGAPRAAVAACMPPERRSVPGQVVFSCAPGWLCCVQAGDTAGTASIQVAPCPPVRPTASSDAGRSSSQHGWCALLTPNTGFPCHRRASLQPRWWCTPPTPTASCHLSAADTCAACGPDGESRATFYVGARTPTGRY